MHTYTQTHARWSAPACTSTASSRRFDVSDVTSLATHHMQLDIGFLSGLCRNGVIYTCDVNFACTMWIRARVYTTRCEYKISEIDNESVVFQRNRLTREFFLLPRRNREEASRSMLILFVTSKRHIFLRESALDDRIGERHERIV